MLSKGQRVLILAGKFKGTKGVIEEVQVGFYFGRRYTVKMDNGKIRMYLEDGIHPIQNGDLRLS